MRQETAIEARSVCNFPGENKPTLTQATGFGADEAADVPDRYKVLFLCKENSARSIMAEALLRELAGDRFQVFSAGSEPAAEIHLLTIAQLRPGISDIHLLSPKSWLEFTGEWAPRMDLVIALSDSDAEYHAPAFPGAPEFGDWRFANPLAEGMTDEERERSFERVFWQILRRVGLFAALPRYLKRSPDRRLNNGRGPSQIDCHPSASR